MIIQASGEQPLFYQKQTFKEIDFWLGMLPWCDRLVDCTFVNCKIKMVDPNALLLSGCRFFGCEFSSLKIVSLDAFFRANYWEECVFHGTYEGTQFGYWVENLLGRPCPWGDIAIKDCDFSQGVFRECLLSKEKSGLNTFSKVASFHRAFSAC